MGDSIISDFEAWFFGVVLTENRSKMVRTIHIKIAPKLAPAT